MVRRSVNIALAGSLASVLALAAVPVLAQDAGKEVLWRSAKEPK
jgi:hypothetical protein